MASILQSHFDSIEQNFPKKSRNIYLIRRFAENSLAFFLQYIGLTIILESFFAPLWLASGTALALLFLRGITVLPGLWLGSFIAFYLKTALLPSGYFALLSCTQAFVLYWITQRFINPDLIFYRIKPLMKFFFLSVIICLISTFIFSQLYFSNTPHSYYLEMELWLANLNGLIIFSFGLSAWDAYYPQLEQLTFLRKIPLIIIFCIIIFLSSMINYSQNSVIELVGMLLLFPLVILVSYSYQWFGMIAAMFIVGLTFSIGCYLYLPKIHVDHFSIITIQLYCTLLYLAGSCIAIENFHSKKEWQSF